MASRLGRDAWARAREHFNPRVFVIRILADGLAIAAVVGLVPGLQVTPDHPLLAFLWLGLVYGVLEAVVGPVLRLMIMPFVVQTYGLVFILADVIIFSLIGLFTSFFTHGSLLALLGGGVLLAAACFALDGVLGLTPPVVPDDAAPAEEG